MAVSREKVVHNAEKYVSRGKIESAIKEYRKLLHENPNDISTLNRVGDLYARINRNSEAIDLFTQIAEQYADDGFFVKAIAIYKKIIKLDPTLLEVYEQLADLYHRQGLVNEARTQYQVLADYYLKHERTGAAIGIYRRMTELEPDDPSHHVKLADLYQAGGQTEEAMGEYRAIADLMLQHDRGNEAARVYERALDVTAEDMGFITDGVLKLKEGGHVAAAAHFLALAVERNPKAEKVARIAGLPERAEEASGPAEEGPEAAEPAAEAEAVATPGEPEEVEVGFDLVVEEPAPEASEEEAAPSPAGEDEPATEPLEVPAAELTPEEPPELEPGLFELELDDDEPESLVRPPADMLEDRERRGAAWEAESAAERAPPAPAEAPPEPEEPAPEPEEAPPEPEEPAGGTFEFELDLDAEGEELLEAVEEPEPSPARAETETELDHDLLERTAAEVQPDRTHEIEDLLTEAEVLARYGIEEKALERLAELLQREPENLEGYGLMIGIHLDAGRHGRVAAVATQMAEVAERLGDEAVWPELRERLTGVGYRIEPGRIEPPVAVPAEEDEAAEAPAAEPAGEVAEAWGEPGADLEAGEEHFELSDVELEAPEVTFDGEPAGPVEAAEVPEEADVEAAASEAAAEPAPSAEPRPEEAPERRGKRRGRADVDSALADLAGRFLGHRTKRRPAPPEPEAPSQEPEGSPPAAETPPAGPPLEAPPPDVAAEASPPQEAAPVDPLRELGASLRAEIGDADEVEPAGERVGSGRDPDDTGMSWLDEVAAAPPEEQGVFEDEADFFDLGAELEQELSVEVGDEDLVMEPAEQSLEEIVEGFKRGVAENLSPEDFDTHFNLGIAYREMGLLDEAIGEFQLAAKQPSYLVACASMLGLCFREKGLPELAVKWYQRGLDAPGVSEDDRLGLLYDLGEAQEAAGDRRSAYHTFVDLYGINTNYRDVVARLAELEPVG